MRPFFLIHLCLFYFSATLCAQSVDSIILKKDSFQISTDSVNPVSHMMSYRPVFKLKNKLLNTDTEPISFAVQFKKTQSKDPLFYLIAVMVFMLASLKYVYHRYFTNLFRVFFNTSLRQSQLTDQLLQAKLPSLLFNLFFVISGGLFIYILLSYFHLISGDSKWVFIFFSMVLMGLIYFLKFCTLKFTGWITGLKDATNTYLFVLFLINKIIGIFLVPFIIILSFSDYIIVSFAVPVSLISIGIFILLRFFRSYGLIQNQLKISRFHFFLYIMGVEIWPLLLIYKGLMIYLSKNL